MGTTFMRAMKILEYLAESPRSGRSLADAFPHHRTTLVRQLRAMEEAGMVVARHDGTFAVGPQLIDVSFRAVESFDLLPVASAAIRRLHMRVGHTVHLAQLIDDSIVYIDKVEVAEGVRFYSRVGRNVQPHCSALGKAILSCLQAEQIDVILQHCRWTAYTPNTITSRAELDWHLREARETGHAVDDGEFEGFLNCVAVPLCNPSGTVVGAVSVTSLQAVADLDDLRRLLPELQATAADITRQLT